jgi:hypothetical protein
MHHFTTLSRGLRFAFRDLDAQHDALTMQRRYIAALMRIADFAHDTGIGKQIASSLLELAMAISELEDGITNPVLEARKLKHRAPDSGFIWIERARLVYAYELFLASGLRSSAAIKRIQECGNAFDQLLARIMHQVACFCVRVDQARTGPSGGIGVRQLAVQRVWG